MRWFCDKLVASFVPRLIGSIYRCRRIGEAGAQQIQMDVGTLKAALLDLPALGQARCLPPPCSAHYISHPRAVPTQISLQASLLIQYHLLVQ